MPDRTYIFTSEDGIDFENEGIFVNTKKGFLSLRRTNEDKEYDLNGTLKPTYADLPTWNPLVFESFFGFMISCDENDGEIKFQISPDGGDTYLYYDGADWVSTTDRYESNTWLDVEDNIEKFPKEWSVLRIRVHIFPSTLDVSPKLYGVSLLIDYRIHEMVEDVHRSIVRFFKSSLNFVFPVNFELKEVSDRIEFEYSSFGSPKDIESSLKVKEPIWVYNIDKDPTKKNNLFKSFNGSDTIIMKEPTVGRIEVIFTSEPDVHIQTDYDLVPVSTYPLITIQVVSVERSEWDGPGNFPCYEINFSKKLAKAREGLRKYRVKVRIRSYSSKSIDSLMFTGGVRRLIEQTDRVKSLNYDTYMEALWGPQSDSDWVTRSLFAENYTPTFIWEDWQAQGKAKEVPLVDDPKNDGGVILNFTTIKC